MSSSELRKEARICCPGLIFFSRAPTGFQDRECDQPSPPLAGAGRQHSPHAKCTLGMAGGHAERTPAGIADHIGTQPVRTRTVEGHFECVVDRSAQKKDNADPQANAGLHAPVERRQKQQKKRFSPKEGEEFHGRLQPAAKALKEDVPSNANVPDGFHRISQNGGQEDSRRVQLLSSYTPLSKLFP
jgi:hypothetical protein